ncbi:MAG: DnaD domain protein, partial [Angelakisella sp.]
DEGLIRSLFGINDRELSAKEKNYIATWFGDYGFDTDLIKLAYEKTVDNTGKVAFPYIHKILSQWHTNGIRTVEGAEREMNAKQPRKGAEDASFDLRDIERVMSQNSNR